MTSEEQIVYDLIARRVYEGQKSPTLDEMGEAVGKGRAAGIRIRDKLVRDGLVLMNGSTRVLRYSIVGTDAWSEPYCRDGAEWNPTREDHIRANEAFVAALNKYFKKNRKVKELQK